MFRPAAISQEYVGLNFRYMGDVRPLPTYLSGDW